MTAACAPSPPSFQRVGHGGASALAAANTVASFEAAMEIGVDMIEFDVRGRAGELVLAHTVLHGRRGRCLTLPDALAHLSDGRFRDVELNVDIKNPGCERATLDALHSSGVLRRTLITSQVPEVLDRLRALEPAARVGISVGRWVARRSGRRVRWRDEVLTGVIAGRWEAVMLQHRLIDAAIVAAVQARGGTVFAWTVNDRASIARMQTLAVDGIVSADPRLFV